MKIYYILYPFLTPKFLTWTLVVTLVTVDRHLLRWPWVTRVVHVVLINVGFWVEGLVSWVICGSKVLASGLKMLVSGADSCLGRDEGLPGMTPRVTREWCGGSKWAGSDCWPTTIQRRLRIPTQTNPCFFLPIFLAHFLGCSFFARIVGGPPSRDVWESELRQTTQSSANTNSSNIFTTFDRVHLGYKNIYI